MAVYAKVASGLRRSLGSTAGFRRRKPEGLAIAIRQEAEGEDSGSEDEGGPDSPDTPAAAAGSLGGTAVEEPDTPDTPNPAAAFPIAAANAGQGAPNIPSAVGTSEAAPLPAATLAPLPVQPAATGPPAVIQQAPAPAATVSLANVPEVAAPAPILNPVPASTSVVDPIVLPVFESSSVIPQLVPGASLPTAFSEPFGASQASIQQLVSSNELVRVATSVPTSFDTVIVTQTSTLPDGLLTVPTSADGSALANANGAIMREDSGRLSPAVEGVLITLGILFAIGCAIFGTVLFRSRRKLREDPFSSPFRNTRSTNTTALFAAADSRPTTVSTDYMPRRGGDIPPPLPSANPFRETTLQRTYDSLRGQRQTQPIRIKSWLNNPFEDPRDERYDPFGDIREKRAQSEK